ncbi:hypothetical protein Q8F55_004684 [Vanrija albida]|uniref:REM-1 domain-containing protein n=1 Tax=Vanrija albida TaxID=181172 RepID=A0ABR3Q7E3_9TREE
MGPDNLQRVAELLTENKHLEDDAKRAEAIALANASLVSSLHSPALTTRKSPL